MAFWDLIDRYVAIIFSILVVGLMAIDKQQYPQWSNILQDIEGSSLRRVAIRLATGDLISRLHGPALVITLDINLTSVSYLSVPHESR